MSPRFLNLLGIILMAGCGSALARHMGLVGIEAARVAGFAIGIMLIMPNPHSRTSQASCSFRGKGC